MCQNVARKVCSRINVQIGKKSEFVRMLEQTAEEMAFLW